MVEPVIISNWKHGKRAILAGIKKLKETDSALDAVEYGIRAVEDDPSCSSVGTGGLPNFEGIGELDASIMIGNTLSAGAVSCLTGVKNPISVARKVIELCPHVMLAGDGARRFARALGFDEYEPVTPKARAKWRVLRKKLIAAATRESKGKAFDRIVGYPTNTQALARGLSLMMRAGEIVETGTVGTLCIDSNNIIVAGTSTSGWPMRLPGRVSDSSVIGAGTYANEFGASSSTGLGEYAIRYSLTRRVCDNIAEGYPPTEACEESLKRMLKKEKVPYLLALIALDRKGNVGGATSMSKPIFTYQYQRLSDAKMSLITPTPVST